MFRIWIRCLILVWILVWLEKFTSGFWNMPSFLETSDVGSDVGCPMFQSADVKLKHAVFAYVKQQPYV